MRKSKMNRRKVVRKVKKEKQKEHYEMQKEQSFWRAVAVLVEKGRPMYSVISADGTVRVKVSFPLKQGCIERRCKGARVKIRISKDIGKKGYAGIVKCKVIGERNNTIFAEIVGVEKSWRVGRNRREDRVARERLDRLLKEGKIELGI